MNTLLTTPNQILASAQSFITAGGYNGFSYADISGIVGIRKASIHHHFPSKADLVRTLVMNYRHAAETGLAGLAAAVPDSLELLRTFAGNWARYIEDTSIPFCVCALLASELPVLPPEVASEVEAYFRALSSWLTAVMERDKSQGTLALEAAASVEAEMFMAIVHGAMLSARAQNNPRVFGAILEPSLRRLAPKID